MYYYVNYENLQIVKSETEIDTSIYGKSMYAQYNSLKEAQNSLIEHLYLCLASYEQSIEKKIQDVLNFK